MNETKLAEDVAGMKAQMGEIYTALVGSPIAKDGGLVNRVALIEQRLDKIDRKQNTLGVQFKVLWSAAGAIASFCMSFFIKK